MRIMLVMELDVELDDTLMIPFEPASKSIARVKTKERWNGSHREVREIRTRMSCRKIGYHG
jgi:hypothetical protein